MPLNIAQKKEIVEKVSEVAKTAVLAITADYKNLTVSQLNEFRRLAREKNIFVKVVPNTLTKRAVNKTDFECLNEELVGPLILVFAFDSPGDAARLVKDFAEKHEQLEVKNIVLSGQLLPGREIEAVSKLPSYDQAIAMLMSVMKAPITKFVRTLAEPHAKLVRLFGAVRDKKEKETE